MIALARQSRLNELSQVSPNHDRCCTRLTKSPTPPRTALNVTATTPSQPTRSGSHLAAQVQMRRRPRLEFGPIGHLSMVGLEPLWLGQFGATGRGRRG